MKQKLSCFIYARKSSESEDRQVASIPAQLEELKKLATQHDLTIADIFIEERSAKEPGRPILTTCWLEFTKAMRKVSFVGN